MGKMSRDKGKVGEREVAKLLRDHGFEAQRGAQYQGGHDSPDVKHNIPGLHIEVKRVEKLNMSSAIAQAKADAGSGKAPAVFHRKSREDWLVTMGALDFMKLVEKAMHPLRIVPDKVYTHTADDWHE